MTARQRIDLAVRAITPARSATALFALLILTLVVGLLVPIYSDEVAWRFQESRYLIDGGVDRPTGETCGANTWATPAFFMLPVRLFSSSVTALMLDPISVRAFGVVLAIVAMVGLRALIRRSTDDVERRALLELTIFGLLGLGVLPFLLVWSRPEQPILLALLACLLLALRKRAGEHEHEHEHEDGAAVVAIVLIVAVAFSYHMKALFYLPVFVTALVLTGGQHSRVRRIAIAALFALAALAYRYWAGRFACPDDPVLAAKLGHENAIVLLLGGHAGDFLRALPAAFDRMLPKDYIRPIMPAHDYMSQWLLPAPVGPVALWMWGRATATLWWGGVAFVLVLLIRAARDRERATGRFVLGLVLLGCATALAGLQINKNAYESALYMPVIVLALLFLWTAGKRDARWFAGVAWTVAGVSVASQLVLIASYAAPLWAADRGGGYIAGQPYSLSAFSYPRAAILAAGAKCGITPHAGSRRVLIDDLTYFAYADSAVPLTRIGVIGSGSGSTGDPMVWLHAHGSPGAVMACSYMPPGMRARAIASGPVCCVGTR